MNKKRTHGEKENVNKMNKEASNPLGVAACCASDFVGEGHEFSVDGEKFRLGKPEILSLVNELDTLKVDGVTLREHLQNPNTKSLLKAYTDAQVLRAR